MKEMGLTRDYILDLQAKNSWYSEYFNILIVDDDPSMTKFIEKVVENVEGVQTYTYNTVKNAVDSFNNMDFDLCIIDINLHKGDGFALGKLFRSMSSREFPIIYISKDKAYLYDFYKNNQPKSFFYVKPIIKSAFTDVFEKMLHDSNH